MRAPVGTVGIARERSSGSSSPCRPRQVQRVDRQSSQDAPRTDVVVSTRDHIEGDRYTVCKPVRCVCLTLCLCPVVLRLSRPRVLASSIVSQHDTAGVASTPVVLPLRVGYLVSRLASRVGEAAGRGA